MEPRHRAAAGRLVAGGGFGEQRTGVVPATDHCVTQRMSFNPGRDVVTVSSPHRMIVKKR